MSDETTHHIRVHLTRERPPIRKAVLEMTGDEVTFGTPGWQGEHYGFDPATLPVHPGTLDYLVASVAGCLIGTFGGALRARDIDATGDRLVADADGEVVVDPDGVLRLRSIALSGWSLVSAYGLCAAALFLFLGSWIASLFTRDPQVIELSAALLVIVGIFQLVDGLQVASSSMLRGLHDARLPAMIGLLSYWVVGIPISAVLAFQASCGPCGIWWGLAAGLAVACVTLGPRLWNRIQRVINSP